MKTQYFKGVGDLMLLRFETTGRSSKPRSGAAG